MDSSLQTPALLLNKGFQPIRIIGARRALVMLYVDVARALDRAFGVHDFRSWLRRDAGPGEDVVHTVSLAVCVPRVLVLQAYDRVPRLSVRLSRRNVFLRDAHTCQYCGITPPSRDLNLDHILPRSRGGPTTWENLVCCCRECNLHKGGRTPEESGMRLSRLARRPGWSPALQLLAGAIRYDEWRPFLNGESDHRLAQVAAAE